MQVDKNSSLRDFLEFNIWHLVTIKWLQMLYLVLVVPKLFCEHTFLCIKYSSDAFYGWQFLRTCHFTGIPTKQYYYVV